MTRHDETSARRSPLYSLIGDPQAIFRRLGGLKRLDVVFAMIGAVVGSLLSLLLHRRQRRPVPARTRLIGYSRKDL